MTEKEQREQASRPEEPSPVATATATATAPIGFWQAFMLPNVLSYAIAFGFFKLVGMASVSQSGSVGSVYYWFILGN